MARSKTQIEPRMVNKVEAAKYCGICEATFSTVCPVRPISLSPAGKAILRYDLRALDVWLDGLGQDNGGPSPEAMLAALGGVRGRRSPH